MESDALPVLPSLPREKLALVSGLFVYTFGCYYAIGLLQDPTAAHSVRTALDDRIPFVPAFMWGYFIVYTSLLMPVFTVRCQRLFRRICLAYGLVVTGCLLVWLVYPVSGVELRGDAAALDMSVFHNWGLRVNYTLDPPMNLFPSLHVAIAVIAALGCWTANRHYGLLSGAIALVIAASICFVKQHYVLDGVAGALLAAAVYAAVVRPYEREIDGHPRDAITYSWWGVALWLVFHIGMLTFMKIVQLSGWAPWK